MDWMKSWKSLNMNLESWCSVGNSSEYFLNWDQKIRKCFATSSEIVWNVRFPDIHHPLIWGINSTRITKLCQSASLEPFTHFNIYSLYFTSFLTTKQVFSHRPSATLLFSIFSWESLFDSSQCLTGQCVTRSLDDDGYLVSEYFHIYIWYKTRHTHRHGPSFRALSPLPIRTFTKYANQGGGRRH